MRFKIHARNYYDEDQILCKGKGRESGFFLSPKKKMENFRETP